MANEKRNSTLVLALALLLFFSGGFLLLVKMGMDARKPATLASGFGSRAASAPAEKATVMDNFKAGAKAAAARVDDLTGGFLGWADEAPQAPAEYASNPGNENSGGNGEDSFEKYYKNNYAGGESDGWSNDSWEEPPSGGSSGAVSFGSGGDSSNTFAPRSPSSRGPGSSDDDGWADPAAGKTSAAPAGGKSRGDDEAPAASKDAGRTLYAALPSSSKSPSTFSDRGSSSSSSSSPQEWAGPGKGSQAARGSLEAMRGSAAAGALDGGSENSRSGGQSSYAAGMAGVAAAAKAAAAGNSSSSPSVSKPSVPSGGSSGSSGSSGDGSSSLNTAAKTAGKTAETQKTPETDKTAETEKTDTPAVVNTDAGSSSEETAKNFFGELVNDRLAGKEVKTEDGSVVTGDPDPELLADASVAASATPDVPVRSRRASAAPEKDNTDFNSLPAARKAQLKNNLQVFLKKVENSYGDMSEIYYTSCESDFVTCRNHGLNQSYVTMITSSGARIAVSLKYYEGKWRPYTLYFKAPAKKGSAVRPSSAVTQEHEAASFPSGVDLADDEEEEE